MSGSLSRRVVKHKVVLFSVPVEDRQVGGQRHPRRVLCGRKRCSWRKSQQDRRSRLTNTPKASVRVAQKGNKAAKGSSSPVTTERANCRPRARSNTPVIAPLLRHVAICLAVPERIHLEIRLYGPGIFHRLRLERLVGTCGPSRNGLGSSRRPECPTNPRPTVGLGVGALVGVRTARGQASRNSRRKAYTTSGTGYSQEAAASWGVRHPQPLKRRNGNVHIIAVTLRGQLGMWAAPAGVQARLCSY